MAAITNSWAGDTLYQLGMIWTDILAIKNSPGSFMENIVKIIE